jgi:hypothetical protein
VKGEGVKGEGVKGEGIAQELSLTGRFADLADQWKLSAIRHIFRICPALYSEISIPSVLLSEVPRQEYLNLSGFLRTIQLEHYGKMVCLGINGLVHDNGL